MTDTPDGEQMRADTRALADAAEKRGIPWVYLGNLHLRLGEGRHQRHLYRTYTDRTSHLGWVIARDKAHTNRVLREAGLPVPRQAVVTSLDEAIHAASEMDGPVVVKPRSADNGVGITVGITEPDQVATAFRKAIRHEEGVLVEQQIPGDDYRLFVVGDRTVAAARREAAHLVGDGVRSVTELIAEVNLDPLRGEGKETPLRRLVQDDDSLGVLRVQGHAPDSVPDEGERVFLRTARNVSMGGTATDVTDLVHPDNRDLAVRATRTVGLDVAGVDFLTPDIARSHRDAGGGVCEVNPTPGMRMHLWPSEGEPRDVAGAIIDLLFPPDAPSP